MAFAGRSNAGKSSAVNALCAQRKLARIGKTPGRTQLINFFELPGGRLVDLPGYGFARVPPRVRAAWQALVERYVAGRENLRGLVLIMDARHPLKPFDEQLLEWGSMAELPFHVLLTKADKLSRNSQARVRREVSAALPEHDVQLFSATAGTGLEEARAKLAHWLSAPDHE